MWSTASEPGISEAKARLPFTQPVHFMLDPLDTGFIVCACGRTFNWKHAFLLITWYEKNNVSICTEIPWLDRDWEASFLTIFQTSSRTVYLFSGATWISTSYIAFHQTRNGACLLGRRWSVVTCDDCKVLWKHSDAPKSLLYWKCWIFTV